jgi:hypothetical protein
MCFGCTGSSRYWDAAFEDERAELLEQEEREGRDALRASLDEELERLGKAALAETSKASSHE